MQHKTVYFKTLGCKVNQYETQGMRERLTKLGLRELDHPEGADCLVLNSCTVTRESDRKTLYYIRRFKKANPAGKVVITGCLVDHDPSHILQEEQVDITIPNREKDAIDKAIAHIFETIQPLEQSHNNIGISSFKGHVRAFVKIQDGCNMHCSYCKVRLVRGASRSRALVSIVDEVQALVRNGYKEIVLTGVQLGSYGNDLSDGSTLATVMQEVALIPSLERVRLSSLEPFDVTPPLLACIAQCSKVCPHVHIPLQSGDNAVLRRMRRAYTVEQYKALIQLIQQQIPQCGISTDVIVGFPGENDHAFTHTINTLMEIQPFKIHIFPFSPREGTDAFHFHDTIPTAVITERERTLQKLNTFLFKKYSSRFIHTIQPVLIEGGYKNSHDVMIGRTPQYVKVIVRGDKQRYNTIVPVHITGIDSENMNGVVHK